MQRHQIISEDELKGLSLKSLSALIATSLLLTGAVQAAGLTGRVHATQSLIASGACAKTSMAGYSACFNEREDDFWIGWGKCNNINDSIERNACFSENRSERREGNEECLEQLEGRGEVCELLGESRYDPEYSPEDFVDPAAIGDTVTPNPYFPLVPGNRWVYEGDGEIIVVEVLDETTIVDGVLCAVVRDTVSELPEEDEGESSVEADEESGDEEPVLIEDTIDWYAQDTEGNVWYFGEISQNFEDGELTDLEGSWKTGREGAQAGILVHAMPLVDSIYRQEFLLGDAEDMARVVSLDATPDLSDENPADCNSGCLQTDEWTPLEAGSHEFKYYQAGIGFILEEKPDSGEILELVEFSSQN